MGFLDKIKGMLPKAAPPIAFEPTVVRHPYATVSLPPGWRFTRSEMVQVWAEGPQGCSAELQFVAVNTAKGRKLDAMRGELVKLLRFIIKDGQDSVLPGDILWMESALKAAALNPLPRDPIRTPVIVHVSCAVPKNADARDIEPLKAALRAAQWN